MCKIKEINNIPVPLIFPRTVANYEGKTLNIDDIQLIPIVLSCPTKKEVLLLSEILVFLISANISKW